MTRSGCAMARTHNAPCRSRCQRSRCLSFLEVAPKAHQRLGCTSTRLSGGAAEQNWKETGELIPATGLRRDISCTSDPTRRDRDRFVQLPGPQQWPGPPVRVSCSGRRQLVEVAEPGGVTRRRDRLRPPAPRADRLAACDERAAQAGAVLR